MSVPQVLFLNPWQFDCRQKITRFRKNLHLNDYLRGSQAFDPRRRREFIMLSIFTTRIKSRRATNCVICGLSDSTFRYLI